MENNISLNDFTIDILQDFIELESMLKVLRDSAYNKNNEITMLDIANTLEIIIPKLSNTKISLNKYIDTAFNKEIQ